MKQLIALFALLIMGTAFATCPNNVRVCLPKQQQTVQQVHQVHNQVIVPTVAVVPATVIVQAYSASYDQHAANNNAIAEQLKILTAEIVKLREALAVPLPPTADGPPDIKEFQARKVTFNEKELVAGLTNCAQCHQPATSDKKGGGFVLFEADGKTKDFKDKTTVVHKKIVDSVVSGAMPKKGKLTDEQKNQIINFYSPQEPEPANKDDDSTPQK